MYVSTIGINMLHLSRVYSGGRINFPKIVGYYTQLSCALDISGVRTVTICFGEDIRIMLHDAAFSSLICDGSLGFPRSCVMLFALADASLASSVKSTIVSGAV